MTGFLIALGVLVAGVGAVLWKLRGLDSKAKKRLLKQGAGSLFVKLEKRGWVPRFPGFTRDYHSFYPELERVEKAFPVIREECLALLESRADLVSLEKLGGNYTEGGVHKVQWDTLMFKSGEFIEENCALAPRTAALIREVPGVYTAFFSVLRGNQYIAPHWGYYKGFLRYHMGIVVPHDNADGCCWIRVCDDPRVNAEKDRSGIERAEKYFWREGEGVIFDDTYLHDAANESDEPRVVLWFDLRKPMPWPLQAINRLFLWIAHKDASVRKIRDRARVGPAAPA